MDKAETKKPYVGLSKKTKKTIFYAVMVALPLLQFFIFYVCVNINSILLSFQSIEKKMVDGKLYYEQTYTLDTLKEVIQNVFKGGMGVVWKNTFSSYLLTSLVPAFLSVVFSYYIFKKFPFANTFKVLLFLPQVVSGLVLVIMYRYFVVDVLGTIFPNIPDLLDPARTGSFYTMVVFSILTSFGTSIMMYVGAMNNISESILEYAKLDGVSPVQELIFIVFPMVYPTFVTFLIVGLAGVFTNQLRIFDFYGSGAERYLQTFGYHMYAGVKDAGIDMTKYPYYAAMGILFTVLTVPVTFTVKYLLNKIGPKTE